MKRRFLIALALALVLLVPGTPAPTRAGTFEFVIPGPVLLLIEVVVVNEKITEIPAVACLGTNGSLVRWIGVTADSEGQVDRGYVGTAAKLKDQPDKFKATFKDKAKDAASEEIQFVDVDASTDPDTGTAEGVKAGMKGKAAYVIDPTDLKGVIGVTSGKLKVKDKTNKEKLTITANLAAKVTESTCTVEFDTAGKAISLRVGDAKLGGLDIHLGR